MENIKVSWRIKCDKHSGKFRLIAKEEFKAIQSQRQKWSTFQR